MRCAWAASALLACGRTGLEVPHVRLDAGGTGDGAARDGGVLVDARGSGCDTAGVASISPPRPVAPISTGFATVRRPSLRWILAPGTSGACVDLCTDRTCTSVIASLAVDGASVVPPDELRAGVIFWRLRGRSGRTAGASFSPTWAFTVGPRSSPVDTSWGARLDTNGDGFGDAIVSATEYGGNAGRVYVFTGGVRGLSPAPAAILDAPDGPQSAFGTQIGSAGDVNGDGFSDVVVTAPSVNGGEGRAYLYTGGPSGLATAPAVITPPTGVTGFALDADGLGDIDGDGYADVAIGAKAGQMAVGQIFVYRGSATGLGTPAFVLHGDGDAFEFFARATTAGDIDGDGFSDVLVPAGDFNPEQGRVYVYRGGATGLDRIATIGSRGALRGYFGNGGAAGDVNGDGHADVIAGADGTSGYSGYIEVYLGGASGLATTPAVTLGDTGTPEDFLNGLVATVGDVNDDGFDDVAVGAGDAGMDERGHVRVYYGSASGLNATSVVLLTGPDAPYAHFGSPFARPDDFDGDGIADLAVAALDTGTFRGGLYEYLGRGGGLRADVYLAIANPSPVSDFFGASVAWVGSPDAVRRARSLRARRTRLRAHGRGRV